MDSGRFGPSSGSSASGDDRFGYFGGMPSPGSVAGMPASTVPYAQSVAAPAGSTRPSWLPALAVAVVLALAACGGWLWTHQDAIVLPDHLGALAINTDVAAAQGQINLQTNDGKVASKVAAYGPSPAKTALVISRGANTAGYNLFTSPGLLHFGQVTCAAETGFVICLRADSGLAVVVQSGSPGVTPEVAAGYVQQAWDAQ